MVVWWGWGWGMICARPVVVEHMSRRGRLLNKTTLIKAAAAAIIGGGRIVKVDREELKRWFNYHHHPHSATNLPASTSIHTTISVDSRAGPDQGQAGRRPRASPERYSTVAKTSQEFSLEDDFLSFIISTFDHIEGPRHCWLNQLETGKSFAGKNDVFLVLSGAFSVESTGFCNAVNMLEKVKLLQERYPKLHVIGFQSTPSPFSDATQLRIYQMAMKDYITFPILLSSKTFTEVASGRKYILLKGVGFLSVYSGSDLDTGVIEKAIKELMLPRATHEKPNMLQSSWAKEPETIKEPLAYSSVQNLLLNFPGCISADKRTNRFFLSDTNHHRIVVFDGSGKILDCIGSSPGFEDGDFDSAKLMRPAGSFYHEVEDCLYFVDSENHAVRKADIERRIVETLNQSSNANKSTCSVFRWIMDKFSTKKDLNNHSEKWNSKSFMFPWHMIKSSEKDIFVINQNLETLWIIDLASGGAIKETVTGYQKISEICGHLIPEKSLKKIPYEVDMKGSFDAGLLPSLISFEDYDVICDTVGQRVLKIDKVSGISSSFNFSNFGVLGVPYWVASPLERVCITGDALSTVHVDHVENFNLLPGKVDIQLNIEVPADVELVEPLQEGCVWRQARGAATEVSGAESKEASTEKMGIAQQWYDEIDHLVTPQEVELNTEKENPFEEEENSPEGQVSIDCTVHTSPGTSEVVISAALYLKLKGNPNSSGDLKERQVARIADILNLKGADRMRKDPFIHLLMKSNSNIEELVFMRPINVRLKFDTSNHPKSANSKDFILTDSSVEVNVSLR